MMKLMVVLMTTMLLIIQITEAIPVNEIEEVSEETIEKINMKMSTDFQWPMSGNDIQNTCLSIYSTSQNNGYEKKCYRM